MGRSQRGGNTTARGSYAADEIKVLCEGETKPPSLRAIGITQKSAFTG